MTGRVNLTSNIISLCILAISAYWIISLATRLELSQWDFKTYYYAGKVAADGKSPYDDGEIRLAAHETLHPFLYPPAILPFLKPLALLSYETARAVWYWLHIFLLGLLIWLWRRYFLVEGPRWQFYLIVLLAFEGAMCLDVDAGNVSLLEQVPLWLGFLCLLRRQTAAFCALIVVAALFKFTPILFLGLLLMFDIRRKWLWFFGTLGLFLIIHLISYLSNPAMFSEAMTKMLEWDERADNFNPSTLALVKDLEGLFRLMGLSSALWAVLKWVLYAGAVGTIGLVSWRLLRRFLVAESEDGISNDKMMFAILVATLVVALVAPRFKIYSYIMVLPATFFVMRKYAGQAGVGLVLILVLLSAHPHWPYWDPLLPFFWWYFPLFMVYMLWGVWVKGVRGELQCTNDPIKASIE